MIYGHLVVRAGLFRGVDGGSYRGIVHLLGQWPGYLARTHRAEDVRHDGLGASAGERNAVLAHPHRRQPQDLSVLDHLFPSSQWPRRPFGAETVEKKRGAAVQPPSPRRTIISEAWKRYL